MAIFGSLPALIGRGPITQWSRADLFNMRRTCPTSTSIGFRAATAIQRFIRPRGKKSGQRHNGAQSIKLQVTPAGVTRRPALTTDHHERPVTRTAVKFTSCYDLKFCINMTLWNARSMTNKMASLCSSIVANRTDVFLLTESWITEKNRTLTDADFSASLSGYTHHHVPRYRRRGGGIALLVRNNLRISKNKVRTFKSFEVMDVSVHSGAEIIHIIVIYRPPYSAQNKFTVQNFLTEFSSLLESALLDPGHLIITGDMNIHVDDPNDNDAVRFLDLVTSLGLVQHVKEPTHKRGHTLDLILTRAADSWLADLTVDWTLPSDHAGIHFVSAIHRPPPTNVERSHRSIRSMDKSAFKDSIEEELRVLVNTPPGDVNELCDSYVAVLQSAIDQHAPLVTRVMTDKPRAPWFTEAILDARRDLRTLERRWQKSHLEVDKQIFQGARDAYVRLLDETKADYHKDRINNADQQKLFRIIDEISGSKRSAAGALPDCDGGSESLPDKFAQFFSKKIIDIRERIGESQPLPEATGENSHSLMNFAQLSVEDIRKLVLTMNNKSCSLDPIPTDLLKDCSDCVAPVLAEIVNSSFATGTFPASCKKAIVRPLIKKAGLDKNEFKNYRPVSNCSFMDKLLEKCAFVQLNDYLCQNSLYGKFQSAYREGHSTETALLRVHNDVMLALDEQKDVILIMLDLSAAFDTIDHDILMNRLRLRFGIDGLAFNWLDSFLRGRTQQVTIGSMVSKEPQFLEYGVPQGSVLGPVLFSLYMSPLEDIISAYGLNCVIFADDTQLYVTCRSRTDYSCVASIEACVDQIRQWMCSNMLALNEGKTELLWFTSKNKKVCDRAPADDVRVGDVVISPSKSVRNLGVIVDSSGAMTEHVSSVCSAASYSLWRIGKIRHLLDRRTTEKLVHAFITSKLDYCNSLLFGLPDYQIRKLQLLQNSAARLVTRLSPKSRQEMTPILQELHWLPVEQRILFKILCIIFKVIHHSTAPRYLTELLVVAKPTRCLRTSVELKLVPPPIKVAKSFSKMYGERSLYAYGPKLWNGLPKEIRDINVFEAFKGALKTHIYRNHFKV